MGNVVDCDAERMDTMDGGRVGVDGAGVTSTGLDRAADATDVVEVAFEADVDVDGALVVEAGVDVVEVTEAPATRPIPVRVPTVVVENVVVRVAI